MYHLTLSAFNTYNALVTVSLRFLLFGFSLLAIATTCWWTSSRTTDSLPFWFLLKKIMVLFRLKNQIRLTLVASSQLTSLNSSDDAGVSSSSLSVDLRRLVDRRFDEGRPLGENLVPLRPPSESEPPDGLYCYSKEIH